MTMALLILHSVVSFLFLNLTEKAKNNKHLNLIKCIFQCFYHVVSTPVPTSYNLKVFIYFLVQLKTILFCVSGNMVIKSIIKHTISS